jgi:hypothetical protein
MIITGISLHITQPEEVKLGQLIREASSGGVRQIVALGMGNIKEYCQEMGIKVPRYFHADNAYPVLVQTVGLHINGAIKPRRVIHTILWLHKGSLYPLSRYGYWGQPKRFVEAITCKGAITQVAAAGIYNDGTPAPAGYRFRRIK